ncbi:MAG: RNA 2',3'-cyclic phosphodiesterase [Thiohalocapsa sp.]
MATERFFFALWPQARVRDALSDERRRLPGRPGKLSHPLDLHMTLVFIGPVDETVLPCVESAADDVILAPFSFTLDALCSWPKQRLWLARPDEPPRPLLNLVSQLQQHLLACGLPPEARSYRPHVTLARRAPPLTACPISLGWEVGDFVLAASAPIRTPTYRVIRAWPLMG